MKTIFAFKSKASLTHWLWEPSEFQRPQSLILEWRKYYDCRVKKIQLCSFVQKLRTRSLVVLWPKVLLLKLILVFFIYLILLNNIIYWVLQFDLNIQKCHCLSCSPPAGELIETGGGEAPVLLAQRQHCVSLLCTIYLNPTQIWNQRSKTNLRHYLSEPRRLSCITPGDPTRTFDEGVALDVLWQAEHSPPRSPTGYHLQQVMNVLIVDFTERNPNRKFDLEADFVISSWFCHRRVCKRQMR